MIIAFYCYTNSEFEAGPVGILRLDAETAAMILGEVEHAQKIIGEKKFGICSIDFWDSSIEWFDWFELDETFEWPDKDDPHGYQYRLEQDGHVVLPEDADLTGKVMSRTEVNQLTVMGGSFFWNAILKHSDIRFETQAIDTEDFKDLVKGLFKMRQERIIP